MNDENKVVTRPIKASWAEWRLIFEKGFTENDIIKSKALIQDCLKDYIERRINPRKVLNITYQYSWSLVQETPVIIYIMKITISFTGLMLPKAPPAPKIIYLLAKKFLVAHSLIDEESNRDVDVKKHPPVK